eukprot:TRINITY_DN9286_c0_g1_i2.p1 TRINITY_DN9286_c0_g1~~TRINITY_DN9286_c0_g1_i2.p1  ORF type:complete len:1088 (+),score=261.20 TRINITY_DN9286_c0_g1_i2:62-3325(+)
MIITRLAMAAYNSFDELCKASEVVFDSTKYVAYCRSFPKLLDKAKQLRAQNRDMEAFMLLWRSAFIAAKLQDVPQAKQDMNKAMKSILGIYDELDSLKPTVKASFKPAEPERPMSLDSDVDMGLFDFPSVPDDQGESTSSMSEADLLKLQQERGWKDAVPDVNGAESSPFDSRSGQAHADIKTTPSNLLADLSLEDYTSTPSSSMLTLDTTLLQPDQDVPSTQSLLPLCSSKQLFSALTTALVIDVRSRSHFIQGHIQGILGAMHCCNIPLDSLASGMDVNQIADMLRGQQKIDFEERNNYQPIVVVTDRGWADPEQLQFLIDAFTRFHMGKPLQHQLQLLDGGYQDYYDRFAQSCTGPPATEVVVPEYVSVIEDVVVPKIESIEEEEARIRAEQQAEQQRIQAEKDEQARKQHEAKMAREAALKREQEKQAQLQAMAAAKAEAARQEHARKLEAKRKRAEQQKLRELEAKRKLAEAQALVEAKRQAQQQAKAQHEKEMAELAAKQAMEDERRRRLALEETIKAQQLEMAKIEAEVAAAKQREEEERIAAQRQAQRQQQEMARLATEQRRAAQQVEDQRRKMEAAHQAQLNRLAMEHDARRARAKQLAAQARRQPKPGAQVPTRQAPVPSSVPSSSGGRRPSSSSTSSSTFASSSAAPAVRRISSSSTDGGARPGRAPPAPNSGPTPTRPAGPAPAATRQTPSFDRSRKPAQAASIRFQPAFRRARMDSMQLVHAAGKSLPGLRNLGNTCFMNSILQCLVYTTPLTLYFTQGRYRNELNRANPMGCKGELAEEYAALVTEMAKQSYRHLAPRFFKDTLASFAPQFTGYQQQDAQEFASFFLDGLHEDLNRVRKKPVMKELDLDGVPDPLAAEKSWQEYMSRHNSIVTDLFQGQYRSSIRCSTCNYESVNFSPFMFLTVPLAAGRTTTLRACLKELSRTETVSGNDTWKCPRCKCHRKAVKSLGIWRLPKVLIIHLKRFTYDGPFRDKLQTQVDFPIRQLNMREHVMNPELIRSPPRYDLFGISNHYGNMSGGHYIAFAKEPVQQTWHKFDDSTVTRISESQLCTSAAYVLFYTQMDFGALQRQSSSL